MNLRLLSAGLALAVSAWTAAAFAEPPPPDVTPSPDTAWLVIGIRPDNVRMEVDEPWVKKGVVWSFHYNMDSYRPVDGFILVKAHPGKVYGVAASSLMAGKSIFGMRYKPDCGTVPTFQAEAGKVVYFTTITYRTAGAEVSPVPFGLIFFESASYSQDLDGARAFLKAHYPGLSDSLEQGAPVMAPFARKCEQPK